MTHRPDLLELFSQLNPPPVQGPALVLTAVRVPGWPRTRVAKDARGRPAVLVSVDGASIVASASIELVNFSYQPYAHCQIDGEDNAADQPMAILLCRAEDPGLQEWFLRTVAVLVGDFVGETRQALDEAVERLVRLFMALGNPPKTSVQGLWGELLIIAYSSDPLLMLTAWHADPMEPCDFVSGVARLEVKTARGSRREHHFSLDQLLFPGESRLAVVSVLVQPIAGGASVADLVVMIEQRLEGASGALAKLNEVVGVTLGCDWRRAKEERYCVSSALESMLLYDGASIPKVSPDVPPEVSDVRFKVEMWSVPTFDAAAIAQVQLWRGASPTTLIHGKEGGGGPEGLTPSGGRSQ